MISAPPGPACGARSSGRGLGPSPAREARTRPAPLHPRRPSPWGPSTARQAQEAAPGTQRTGTGKSDPETGHRGQSNPGWVIEGPTLVRVTKEGWDSKGRGLGGLDSGQGTEGGQ